MTRRQRERRYQEVLATHEATCEDYETCPECGSRTECELEYYIGIPYTVVTCPECGVLGEYELCTRNEAAVRY